ncbi:hypothetical protein ACEK07_15035 [Alcanivoracaceae bacterium MT1]
MLLPHRLHSHQWYHRTVSQLFAETCGAHADKPAILFEGQTLPFGELFDQVQDMAQGLLELGIDKGDVVSTTRVTTNLLELFQNLFDDVKTVGIDDAYWGTRVVSFVRTRDEQPLPPSPELREACKGRMAAYEIPKDFLPWSGEWPVTAEGKIDFKRLQQHAQVACAGTNP